jgi:alpha-glucosidase
MQFVPPTKTNSIMLCQQFIRVIGWIKIELLINQNQNKMKRLKLLLILIFALAGASIKAKDYTVTSPDRTITVKVSYDNELKFSVLYNGQVLIDPSPVSMELEDITPGREGKIVKKSLHSVDRVLTPVVRIKSEKVTDRYNEMKLTFDKNYAFTVRVYNDGIGYRFETEFGDSITVKKENARKPHNLHVRCKRQPKNLRSDCYDLTVKIFLLHLRLS